jgi:hypothetical protein
MYCNNGRHFQETLNLQYYNSIELFENALIFRILDIRNGEMIE